MSYWRCLCGILLISTVYNIRVQGEDDLDIYEFNDAKGETCFKKCKEKDLFKAYGSCDTCNMNGNTGYCCTNNKYNINTCSRNLMKELNNVTMETSWTTRWIQKNKHTCVSLKNGLTLNCGLTQDDVNLPNTDLSELDCIESVNEYVKKNPICVKKSNEIFFECVDKINHKCSWSRKYEGHLANSVKLDLENESDLSDLKLENECKKKCIEVNDGQMCLGVTINKYKTSTENEYKGCYIYRSISTTFLNASDNGDIFEDWSGFITGAEEVLGVNSETFLRKHCDFNNDEEVSNDQFPYNPGWDWRVRNEITNRFEYLCYDICNANDPEMNGKTTLFSDYGGNGGIMDFDHTIHYDNDKPLKRRRGKINYGLNVGCYRRCEHEYFDENIIGKAAFYMGNKDNPNIQEARLIGGEDDLKLFKFAQNWCIKKCDKIQSDDDDERTKCKQSCGIHDNIRLSDTWINICKRGTYNSVDAVKNDDYSFTYMDQTCLHCLETGWEPETILDKVKQSALEKDGSIFERRCPICTSFGYILENVEQFETFDGWRAYLKRGWNRDEATKWRRSLDLFDKMSQRCEDLFGGEG